MISPPAVTKSSRRPLLIVILAALLIRIGYLWIYSGMPEWSMLTVDNWCHHNWATVLAGGDWAGDTTYFRAPGYVWMLGVLYTVLGSSLWVGRIFGLLIGVGSVYLTGRIGEKLFSTRVGVVAAILHAVYPVAIYFESELLLDPLFTFCVELSLLQFLRWWEDPKPSRFGWLGLLLGLSTIIRPTALVFVPVMLAVAVIKKDSRQRVRQIAAFALGLALLILPVTIRNLVVGGEPVLVASQAGINLYIGNNEAADGKSAILPPPYGHNWQIADITYEAEESSGRELTPGEVSSYWTDRALDWMLAHPGEFLSLYAKKIYYFFANHEPSNNRNIASFFSRVPLLGYNPLSFGLLLTFAVFGIVAHWREKRVIRILVALVVVYVLAASLFFMNARFRLPILPIFFVLGSAGIFALSSWVKWNPVKAMPTVLLALIIGLLSFLDLFSRPRAIPTTALTRGSYYFEQGDYLKALESFRQAQAVNPHYAEVNLNIGAVYFREGMADSAKVYFEREIANHPHRVKGYTNLASLYLVSGQVDQARDLATSAVTVRPFDQTAWLLLVRAIAQSPDSIASMLPELADDALTATDTNVYVANELAAALAQQGLVADADRVLRAAIASTPPPVEMNDDAFTREFVTGPANWRTEQANSYYQLGYLEGVRGRFGTALEFTNEAVARDSSLVPAWINLVSAYRATGQPNVADSLMQVVLQRFGEAQLEQYLSPPSTP